MKVFLIVLALGFSVLGEETEDFGATMEQFHNRNSLKYKDKCDYGMEKKRQQLMEDFLKPLTNPKSDSRKVDREKSLKELPGLIKATSEGTFCDPFEHLECSPKGVCQCAEFHKAYGFNTAFEREGNECLLTRGSLCAPQQLIEDARSANPFMANTPKVSLKCAENAACVVKSNGKMCTAAAFKSEIKRLAHTHDDTIEDAFKFVMKKTFQGICVCKGASFFPSSLVVMSVFFIWWNLSN